MKNTVKSNNILSINFSESKKRHELWLEEREKKSNLYRDFLEYIEFLEIKLGYESDTYQKFLIKRDIKKLKYQMNKYYVSSIFSICNSEMKFEQKSKDGLLMRVRKVGLKR